MNRATTEVPLRPLLARGLCGGLAPHDALAPAAFVRHLRGLRGTEGGAGPAAFFDALLAAAGAEGVDAQLAFALLGAPDGETLAPPLRARLTQILRLARGRLLAQRRLAAEAREILDAAGIEHLLIKGLSLAGRLYPEPATRAAVDVDLLVPRHRRPDATRAFEAAGFTLTHDPRRASHECDVFCPERHPGVAIDLHWDLFRPGRARCDLAAGVLARREEHAGLFVPADEDLLLLALLHPALTEHVTARLSKAVDLALAARQLSPAWPAVVARLGQAGLRCAAWAQLAWTRGFFELPLPPGVEEALAPGPLRRRALRAYLAANPASLYARAPLLVRAASLALQDRPGDVARALWVYLRRHSGPRRGAED